MNNPQTIRAATPFLNSAKVWRIALCAAVFFLSVSTIHAQTCKLTGIRSSSVFQESRLAIAAHIEGNVIASAVFAPTGSAVSAEIESGPALIDLRKAVISYIDSWKVNETAAGQKCRIVISFRFLADDQPHCEFVPSSVTVESLQHFIVTATPVSTCDPSATMSYSEHRFLFFRWKTNRQVIVNE